MKPIVVVRGGLTSVQRQSVTPFQARVYDAICQIPSGKVATYKGISEAIHCKSSQAIGQALKRNPYAPEIPCHRVVKADLTLGGYGGSLFANAPNKRKRLEEEGVVFQKRNHKKKGERVIDPACVYRFEQPAKMSKTNSTKGHEE
jgi:methylated-DNA-[protein]-cysteine S-methyltransferase